MKRRWALAAAGLTGLAVLLLLVVDAAARPGGGHSYSGGGGHGGSGGGGGGGGGGELVYLLIQLIVHYPHIGIPLAAVVVVLWIMANKQRKADADWDSGPDVYRGPPPELDRIRRLDEDFSVVTFDDFVYRLYAQAHGARGDNKAMEALAPYIEASIRNQLHHRDPVGETISHVIVGAMRPIEVTVPDEMFAEDGSPLWTAVTLEFEANMTATNAAGQYQGYFVVERWTLMRAANVRSKPPGSTEKLPCPNCGAPFESGDSARCAYCNEVVNNGRFDWIVTHAVVGEVKKKGPLLTGTVQERGTDLPTYTQQGVDQHWVRLQHDDPSINDETFAHRLNLIYHEINNAWGNMDLSVARPFVSDGMFDYLQYWIYAYHQQGLRNVNENAQMYHWTYAKIVRDKYFDSVTVRIWGKGNDYTVEQQSGKVVGGSKTKVREYTEYWTLIRSAGRRGPVRADKLCPNCGAEMKINMSGACEYCHAHITAGEFDWVLSKIEQDDSYRG